MRRLLLIALIAAAPVSDAVPFPEGYRSWSHVKSALVHPVGPAKGSFDGIHHIYANVAALEGYRTGRFADEAVLVFDRFSVRADEQGVDQAGRLTVDVMVRDEERYASTGGWGFERFAGDGSRKRLVGANAAKACYQCHATRRDAGFVFSRYEE